jgi:hypothetical protein
MNAATIRKVCNEARTGIAAGMEWARYSAEYPHRAAE